MASRIIAPKMASMVAQSTLKASRPALRASFKPQQLQSRTFSSVKQTSPFQTTKRTQSTILSQTSKTTFSPIARLQGQKRMYSSEMANALVQVSQNLGMGSAAIGLGGAAVGIGVVFAALLMGTARNPALRGQLFSYAILGFAFVEAMGLFDLMIAMMCKYV
ncbi:ATP synthase subunit 9 [Elsinoe fawcettii]|nr:ATP synthase subunit 9 [Elsinoe fawcettii]